MILLITITMICLIIGFIPWAYIIFANYEGKNLILYQRLTIAAQIIFGAVGMALQIYIRFYLNKH
jgi:hypothetical protein